VQPVHLLLRLVRALDEGALRPADGKLFTADLERALEGEPRADLVCDACRFLLETLRSRVLLEGTALRGLLPAFLRHVRRASSLSLSENDLLAVCHLLLAIKRFRPLATFLKHGRRAYPASARLALLKVLARCLRDASSCNWRPTAYAAMRDTVYDVTNSDRATVAEQLDYFYALLEILTAAEATFPFGLGSAPLGGSLFDFVKPPRRRTRRRVSRTAATGDAEGPDVEQLDFGFE
jgi:hypothetical protein